MNDEYHPSLSEALSEFKNKNYEKAKQALAPFLNAEELTLRLQANNFMGLCFFHQEDYKQAVPYFEIACASSTRYSYWCNLTLCYALNEQYAAANKAFKQALVYYSRGKESPSKTGLYYSFIKALSDKKQFELALGPLNELWKGYLYYRVTDEFFLFTQDMPPLEGFLATSLDVLNGLGGRFNGEAWLKALEEDLDEEGRAQVIKWKSKLIHQPKNVPQESFEIPLPLPPTPPLTQGYIKDILEEEGKKYIVGRILQGKLKIGDELILKRGDNPLLHTKCISLQMNRTALNEAPMGSDFIIEFEGVDASKLSANDFFSAK